MNKPRTVKNARDPTYEGQTKATDRSQSKYPAKRTFLKDLVSRVYRPEARLPGQKFTDGDRRSSSLA